MGDLGGLWCGDNFVPVYPWVLEKIFGRTSHVYLTHTSANPLNWRRIFGRHHGRG